MRNGIKIIAALISVFFVAVFLIGCSALPEAEPLNSDGNSGSSQSLVTTDLKTALANGKPTVAEFGSTTCIPCKEMQPILESLSIQYKNKVNIVFVDVYENSDLAGYYMVRAIPTQIFFDKNGQPVTSHIGFFPESEIIVQLENLGVE